MPVINSKVGRTSSVLTSGRARFYSVTKNINRCDHLYPLFHLLERLDMRGSNRAGTNDGGAVACHRDLLPLAVISLDHRQLEQVAQGIPTEEPWPIRDR